MKSLKYLLMCSLCLMLVSCTSTLVVGSLDHKMNSVPEGVWKHEFKTSEVTINSSFDLNKFIDYVGSVFTNIISTATGPTVPTG